MTKKTAKKTKRYPPLRGWVRAAMLRACGCDPKDYPVKKYPRLFS